MKDKPAIMIVDDQPQNLDLLEAYLAPQGYKIIKAASGQEALGKLSGNQIDLILLDVLMPGMDGFEVTRRIRRDDIHRLLPIIMVTVLQETEDRVKGIEAGCDDFISRPVDKMELLARVRSLLKVKAYNDLMSNYRKELESEVTKRTVELKQALENLQQDIAERKQAQEALWRKSTELESVNRELVSADEELREYLKKLSQAEEKYRKLMQTAYDAIFIADAETGTIIDANEQAGKLLDLPLDQIKGMHQSQLHPPEEAEHYRELFRKHVESGRTVAEDVHVCRRDGARIPVEISSSIIELDGRRVNQGVFRDITERKRAEAAKDLNAQRVNALLQLNQMTEATLHEITDYALEEAVRLTQSKIGYLAFLNPDESVLTMHSWSKTAMAECAIDQKPIIYPVATTGLWGEAVRQRRPVITNDYAAANPLKKGTPPGHVAVKRHMNIPVCQGSRIVIVAGVGNKDEEYEQGDVEQLTLLMEGMWRLIDRKRAEEALRESEEKYKRFFMTSRDCVFITSKEGSWVDMNDVAVELFGYSSREELMQVKIPNLYANPEERTKHTSIIEELGYSMEYPVDLRRKDGTVIHTLITSVTLCDAEKNVIGYQGTIRDITGRKRAEEKRQESESKYRTIFDTVYDAIFLMDREKFIDCNAKTLETFGCTKEQIIGQTPYRFSPDMQPDGKNSMEKAREKINAAFSGQPQFFEWKHSRYDGTLFDAEVSLNTVSPAGQRYILAIVRDITERKRAEEALKESREKYRELVENINDVIFTLDTAGNITYISPAVERMFKYRTGEITGYKFRKFVHSDDLPAVMAGFQKSLQGNYESVECRLMDKDGAIKHVRITSRATAENGGVSVLTGAFTDITERKQAENIQQALYKISDAAIGCRDLYQLYIQIHKTIAKLMPAENFYIALYDEKSDTISFPYYKDQKNDCQKPRKFGKGLTEHIITTQKPLLVNQQVHERLKQEGKAEFLGHPSNHWLGVPLQSGNKTFGTLVVQSYDINTRYTQKDLELLNFVAGHVAVAILSIKAAQELAESETRYRTFMDSATDIAFLKDDQLRYLMINQAHEKFFGRPADQVLGKTDYDLMSKEAAQGCHLSDQMVLETSQTMISQEQMGDKIYETRKFPVKLKDGKIGVGAYIRDITESKSAENRLQMAATKWKNTFDSIGDGISLLDRQWEIMQCNRAFSRIVKKPYDEILGRTYHEIVHGLKQAGEHYPTVRLEKSLHRETIELERDGRLLVITADPIFDQQKNLAGAVLIISDISDRKLMEQELLQSQKMEAVGFLAGGVAHDFNNMLAGIVGNAELLQLKIYGQKELEAYVDNIIKASGHAARLTKQLLAFARKGQFQQAPVNVHKILGETVGILGNTIDRRINIEQHLRANPAVILGDHSQLENAFMNLGINARDAMPQGGRLIFATDLANLDEEYIRRHNYKIEPGHYIQVTVEDTGSGMTDEVKRHLFEPFFTTKEKGKGTGLGLAAVYGCVKNHGGSIEVYSEPGRGTAFKLYLPLYGGLAAGEQGFEKLHDLTASGGTGSILIVDDEDMIRTIAAQILKTAGYQVQTCADGQEAVELYSRDHGNIDLVVMDMVMPKVDGREAFGRMQKINPKVKVLLSSGFSEDGDAQALLKEGALGFIQKPYRSAELLSRVQQALQPTKNS